MSLHNHLDQQRRDPGECPRCDELWAEQKARTAPRGVREKAEREIDRLVGRETKGVDERYGAEE